MLRAGYKKYLLQFKFPAETSRGTLHHKETWLVKVWDDFDPTHFGIGECACFRGLSIDDKPDYEDHLREICNNIDSITTSGEEFKSWPSIRFGFETALKDLNEGANRVLYPSLFIKGEEGIPINGLIWMGTVDFVKKQIKEKLDQGFRCLKMKIGAADLSKELSLLQEIRKEYRPADLEIRLDANGAFHYQQALEVLERFSAYSIHSIEQPIRAGQPENMAEVCKKSPIAIALDEELIGITDIIDKRHLLSVVKPSYIILKPSLVGGFKASEEWIDAAKAHGVDWWVTSALESNIGLNAIAQWTYSLNVKVTQGLGTGGMFTNNIPSPLFVDKQRLYMNNNMGWDISSLGFNE